MKTLTDEINAINEARTEANKWIPVIQRRLNIPIGESILLSTGGWRKNMRECIQDMGLPNTRGLSINIECGGTLLVAEVRVTIIRQDSGVAYKSIRIVLAQMDNSAGAMKMRIDFTPLELMDQTKVEEKMEQIKVARAALHRLEQGLPEDLDRAFVNRL